MEDLKWWLGHRLRLRELRESGTLLRCGRHIWVKWSTRESWNFGTQNPTEGVSMSRYTERTGRLPGPLGPYPTGLPGCHLPTSLLAHQPLPTTGGLQHYQMPAPNLPRRCRQTGLDAKGVTPKLLRLKFYSSWTGDFFFSVLFFFSFL
jgi:hypothetical protein